MVFSLDEQQPMQNKGSIFPDENLLFYSIKQSDFEFNVFINVLKTHKLKRPLRETVPVLLVRGFFNTFKMCRYAVSQIIAVKMPWTEFLYMVSHLEMPMRFQCELMIKAWLQNPTSQVWEESEQQ